MHQLIVSSQWLKEQFNDPNLVILDASANNNKSNLATALKGQQIKGARPFHIKEAFSLPTSKFPNMLPSPEQFAEGCRKLGINQSSKIVVYDNLGIYTSPRVWWMFKTMGHENVVVLNGGLPDWAAQGFPIEQIVEKAFPTGDFQATLKEEKVKDFDFIVKNLPRQASIIIDARSAGRFHGVAPEPRKELKSGHIPHSFNIPYTTVLENGKFKSLDELKSIFAKQVLIDDRPLVFSCGSGITACIILLASELVLDNPTSVYDGSWTEWVQRADKEKIV